MIVAEKIRFQFLCQNAYTEDAFSPPDKTLSIFKQILDFYDAATERLKAGKSLDEILTQKIV